MRLRGPAFVVIGQRDWARSVVAAGQSGARTDAFNHAAGVCCAEARDERVDAAREACEGDVDEACLPPGPSSGAFGCPTAVAAALAGEENGVDTGSQWRPPPAVAPLAPPGHVCASYGCHRRRSRNELAAPPCAITTPFGRPVVPPVKSTKYGVSGVTPPPPTASQPRSLPVAYSAKGPARMRLGCGANSTLR